MARDFDAEDKYSWFFGLLSRDETNAILMNQEESGVFLVRESTSMQGDFVLCVKEEARVSHYIINKKKGEAVPRFRIGDKDFPDIPTLLNFYKSHYLDTTTLIRPAPREKLLCKYDFNGRDPEDLPFRRGDILELISKDEPEWWTARNSTAQVGQIPVRYIQKLENNVQERPTNEPVVYQPPNVQAQNPPPIYDVQLPAKAEVILQRIPSAYAERRQLRLEIGEILTVHKMNLNGQWEGELNGKEGIFPFTHIRFLTKEELEKLPA